MKIISCFVREQQRYLKSELQSRFFPNGEQGVEKFIKDLKAYGVLKTVKMSPEEKNLSELMEESEIISDEFADNDEYYYVFNYVGVVTIGKRIVKVYPKYIMLKDEPLLEMKQVLKVLQKYNNSQEQIVNIYNGSGENKSFNILAIILFLMNDYYENGIYNNSEDIIEVNGEGAILWGKTIDETFALIQDDRPYYMELYTAKTIDDDMDFFKRLHEAILTECTKQLETTHLMELFDIIPADLSEDEIEDFGDTEYVLDRIQAELNIQYNTRKQILLKTMYAYISQNRKLLDEEQGISMFGTTAFNMVWEKVCANVFNNKLNTTLEELGLSSGIVDGYDERKKLIDLIETPKWITTDGYEHSAKETLIPDLIAIETHNDVDYFVILDAKYYNIQLEPSITLRGNPGVGDVTKQYLYQLAYKKFLEAHFITHISNCFLMPTEGNNIIDKGRAKMTILSELGLQDIQIRLLPAMDIYKHYLANIHMEIRDLMLPVDAEFEKR